MQLFLQKIAIGLNDVLPRIFRATRNTMNFNFNKCRFDKSGPWGATGDRGEVGGLTLGDDGPKGKDGPTGPTGPAGAKGVDGTRGSLIDYGAIDPIFDFSNSHGDIYYNTHTHYLFRFEEGHWVRFLNIFGSTGQTGDSGPTNSCENPTPMATFLLYERTVNDLSTTSSDALSIVTVGHFGVDGVVAQLTPPYDTLTVTWKIDLEVSLAPSTITLATNIYTNEMVYDGEERSRITRTFTESVTNYTVSSTFKVGQIPQLNAMIFVIPKWSVTSGTLTMNPGGYYLSNVQ